MINLPSKKSVNQWRFQRNVKARKRLYSKLSKMLANSVPVKEALIDLKTRRVEQFGRTDLQSIAISDWVSRTGSGENFAKSLTGWVPPDEQNIIAGGEQSGRVAETLDNLVGILNAKTKIKSTIVKALTYPTLIISIIVVVLAAFGGFMMPMYQEIAPGIHWVGLAKSVSNVTGFFADYILWIFVAIICFSIAFSLSLNRWVDGLRVKLDHFGPWAIFSMLQGVSWLIAFSSLIQAGVTVKDALKQTSLYASPWLKTRIDAISRRLGDYNLGEAMSKAGYDFPSREIINDLSTYSKYSGFDQALKSLADDWLEESIETVSSKVSQLNLVGMLVGAGVIAFMALGMYSMNGQMQQYQMQNF
ncbi:MAG: type II secretion system F family protein [Methyloprofundus sp.]|nr:type II secretion system F family protein [Methyloprofundus sp.]